MSKISFIEKLNRFAPNPEQREILSSVSDYAIRANRENRIMEIDVHLPEIVRKSRLYEIEEDIRKAYGLNRVKLLPKYPGHLLTYDYIPEILTETESVGIVARGFFGDYTYTFRNDELNITISFGQSGVGLLEDANTPRVIENIIFSEFGGISP